MPWLEIIGPLVGGLALFLFGLGLMTGALKAIAGSRLQTALGALTKNRFRGVLAGAGVTALLNSSTITTVLMVGFVSAELMTLDQTVPMIMGANIGSTITAQIFAFNVAVFVPYMLALGFLMESASKKDTLRQVGLALLGLGLLFLGIEFMGNATRPLRTYQPFITAMQEMRNPLIGIAIGAIFTAIVQSSAATLAIVIALGSQGLMPLEAGIALILGANVGTCGTALLAAIGKPREALQVGLVHLMFNVLGVLFLVFLIPQFAVLVRWVSPSSPELEGVARLAAETPRQAANAHTIFSIATTLILIWFAKPMARLAQAMAPSKPRAVESDLSTPRYLDKTTFDVPAFAIGRLQFELMRMGKGVIDLVRRGAGLATSGTRTDVAELNKEASSLDELASAILSFIGQVSDTKHSENEGHQLVDLAQIVAGLDGIREVAVVNLLSIHERRIATRADLAGLNRTDVLAFEEKVLSCLERAVAVIGTADRDEAARIVAAKPEIEAFAIVARQSMMGGLNLNLSEDVRSYRLANDFLEHFNEIARRTRAIARATNNLAAASKEDLVSLA